MPVGRPDRSFVAKLPSVATTRGWISSICRQRCASHASISSGIGSRFPGGRHLSTLATYTSARVSPIPDSSWSSSLPAAPTNGTPCLSSWKPGASPTNIRSAAGSPEPKTTWVRPAARGQRVQPATEVAKAASSSARPSASVAAATAPAATASASAEAGLPGSAVSREHGELLAHVLGAAVRTVGVAPVPDELLEVRLALHADVLVDRHRLGSLGRGSDTSQMWSNGRMWPGLWVPLEGRLVTLEPLRREHEEGLRAAAGDERIWRFMITTDPEAWLRATFAEAEAGVRAPFTALLDGRPMGSTSYMSLAPEHLRLEIGSTWMNPSTWGTGANVEAKYLLLRHAFETLGCLRVELKTDARNERARGALAALPARFEGVHRKHMLVRGGERRDSAWYAVVDDDWPEVKAALEARLGRERPAR